MKPKIFVTGAAGYVGSKLVPALLRRNFDVIAFDTFWYGSTLPSQDPNLTIIKGDLRHYPFEQILKNVDCVIHLACISNDPSFELDPQFSQAVNVHGSQRLIDACLKLPLRRFIFASSSSVYGVKKELHVHEELSLEPLTLYSKNKVDIEVYLQNKVQGQFDYVILRPATLMGVSRRIRLDVVTHILSAQAFFDRRVKVHGGDQFRPQLHIDDMIRAYLFCVEEANDFNGEIFNVGDDNYTVAEIAETVQALAPHSINLQIEKVLDPRSYRISSDKFRLKRGFETQKKIQDGVREVMKFFEANSAMDWQDEKFHNVKRLKTILANQQTEAALV